MSEKLNILNNTIVNYDIILTFFVINEPPKYKRYESCNVIS